MYHFFGIQLDTEVSKPNEYFIKRTHKGFEIYIKYQNAIDTNQHSLVHNFPKAPKIRDSKACAASVDPWTSLIEVNMFKCDSSE
jgi:hypothetical protein